MSVFIDTSACYALLVRTEEKHAPTRKALERMLRQHRPLWTTSYVLIETVALLQSRIGLPAVYDFDDAIVPLLQVCWVDAALHYRGLQRLRQEHRRKLSLVDCVGFEFMKRDGIKDALALDPHFSEAGFKLFP